MMDLHNWLHRKGISRQHNAGTNNMNDSATALLETRGPRWLGDRLWRYTLRYSKIGSRPDWDSFRLNRCERVGHWRYKWHVSYRRTR